MLRSLHTAATGMEAQQLKMDVISNNLANAGTTGFKKARAEFEDLLSETIRGVAAPDARGGAEVAPLQVGLGVRTGTTTRAFSQGDMINTGNPLDIAIEGQGFLKILRANGEVAYTRAGNLRVDATGRLTTQRGELIDPGVTIPADATNIIVRPDGVVIAKISGREEPQEVGTLELNTFPNPGGLLALGYNLFSASAASGDAVQAKASEQGNGTFSQGFLESANVRAVEEMIDMISTQRAYELNSKVIQTADQMLQRLTSLR